MQEKELFAKRVCVRSKKGEERKTQREVRKMYIFIFSMIFFDSNKDFFSS